MDEANLASLPVEILHEICSNLSIEDHKAIRQSCHRLCAFANKLVFSRVHVSLLKADQDAFFNLCQQEQIRNVIEQLVWYDAPALPERTFLAEVLRQRFVESDEKLKGDYPHLPAELSDVHQNSTDFASRLVAAYQASLMPIPLNPEDTKEKRKDDRKKAFSQLYASLATAMEGMPRLRAVVMRPMPYDHPIAKVKGYQLHAGIIQNLSTCREFGIFGPLEAMVLSPKLNVKSLQIAETRRFTIAGILNDSYAKAFENLTNIDLCIGNSKCIIEAKPIQALAACIQRARLLTEIKVCFEDLTIGSVEISIAYKKRAFEELFSKAYWQHLRVFKLTDFFFECQVLRDFIIAHAAKLRHLDLQECYPVPGTWYALIKALAAQPEVNLDYLRLTAADMDALFDSDWLLAVVNNKVALGEKCCPIPFEKCFWDGSWPAVAAQDAIARPKAHSLNIDDGDEANSVDGDNPTFVQAPTWWVLDHLGDEIIFYSCSSSQYVDDYTTEVWKFVRADGSYAYSDPGAERADPLEYFEDWGLEGDAAEPTPFGNSFDDFVAERQTIFFDLRNIEYPEHTRVWLSGYESRELTESDIEAAKEEQEDMFGSGGDDD